MRKRGLWREEMGRFGPRGALAGAQGNVLCSSPLEKNTKLLRPPQPLVLGAEMSLEQIWGEADSCHVVSVGNVCVPQIPASARRFRLWLPVAAESGAPRGAWASRPLSTDCVSGPFMLGTQQLLEALTFLHPRVNSSGNVTKILHIYF